MSKIEQLIAALPKAELHVHIEGTLEPEMMFALARRNGVGLPYASVDEIREAYRFENLQSFLDLYYQGMAVLREEADFYDLARAYLRRARAENVVHAEIFFDPQAHTRRGVSFETVIGGLHRAGRDAAAEFGITSKWILCFLRDLPAAEATATLKQAMPYRDRIAGIGLDSAEAGHPPGQFAEVFAKARAAGLSPVAHAGEEGPAAYVREALDALGATRIDHGIRALEDDALTERLVRDGVPLTVCPLSNVRLRVVPDMAAHPLKTMLKRGLMATVNSDDPAYFGGYINDNFLAAQRALGLSATDLVTLAANSFAASFLEPAEKRAHVAAVHACATGP